MNPIVHAELSWLLAQGLPARRDRILVTVAGLAPDLDGLSLLGGLDAYGRWHHLLFHGALGAAVTAAACAAFARSRGAVAALALAAFHLHLGCDLLGSGPGWPLWYFWPFDRTEWFWDGQWDLASWQNSAIGLCATLLCLLSALVVRRTAVEVLSPRADAAVTAAVRRRFGRSGA
ncbi:MAG TPA: metal-dependent hydrolase [Myxococcales bacterium]|nr:metal-dependent hydrolase [Myxococcales bacterium]